MLSDSIVLVSYVWSERAHSYLKLNQNWKSQSQPLANPLGIIHSWRSAVKMINTHVLCPWSHYHSLSALLIGCCASLSANRGQLGAVTKRSGWQMQHTRNLQPTSLWESSCRSGVSCCTLLHLVGLSAWITAHRYQPPRLPEAEWEVWAQVIEAARPVFLGSSKNGLLS